MNAIKRRNSILYDLEKSDKALKGSILAEKYSVTRQIIVKDIAILRAQGNSIIATPDGYVIGKEDNRIRRIIAVTHSEDRLSEELNIIINYFTMIVKVNY